MGSTLANASDGFAPPRRGSLAIQGARLEGWRENVGSPNLRVDTEIVEFLEWHDPSYPNGGHDRRHRMNIGCIE
jgi:hypothetical protein